MEQLTRGVEKELAKPLAKEREKRRPKRDRSERERPADDSKRRVDQRRAQELEQRVQAAERAERCFRREQERSRQQALRWDYQRQRLDDVLAEAGLRDNHRVLVSLLRARRTGRAWASGAQVSGAMATARQRRQQQPWARAEEEAG